MANQGNRSPERDKTGNQSEGQQDKGGSAQSGGGQGRQSGMNERPSATDDLHSKRDSESRNQGGVSSDEDMTTGQGTGTEGGRS